MKRKDRTDLTDVVLPRIAANRRNGAAGARKTNSLHADKKQAWGEKGGGAVLAKYGRDYYRHIRSLRKPFSCKRKTHQIERLYAIA